MESQASPTSSTTAIFKTFVVDREEKEKPESPHRLMDTELTSCEQSAILETSLVNLSLETNANMSCEPNSDKETPGKKDKHIEEVEEEKKGKKKQNKVVIENTPIPNKLRSFDGKEKIDFPKNKEGEENTGLMNQVMAHVMCHVMAQNKEEKDKEDSDEETNQNEFSREEDHDNIRHQESNSEEHS